MMDFSSVKRIVIKVGTSTLAHNTGNLNIRRVSKLIEVMSDLKNSGKDVIFVTSGAQGVGAAKAGLHSKPKEMPKKQACAAIGQCELMHIYDREFANYNHTVAQVLLTRDVISNKTRKENVINTFNTLLDMGIVPIINANDTVSIQELDFDENDTLSAIVAALCSADLLIILTDVDGLYDKNPKLPGAKLIPEVKQITSEMISSAKDKGSEFASGGMITVSVPRYFTICLRIRLSAQYSPQTRTERKNMSYIDELGKKAKSAAKISAMLSQSLKNDILATIAAMLENGRDEIKKANELDITAAHENNMAASMVDRLTLTDARIDGMAEGVRQVAALPDPVGKILGGNTLPNGLTVIKKSVPLGVIGIIFESRPNVTVDAGCLCLKAGNTVILRGGSDAINSNKCLVGIMRAAAEKHGVNPDIVQLVEDTSRDTATELMKANEYVDVLIPRGGGGLINAVIKNATVPVIQTGEGNCHVYVDRFADIDMAVDIVDNAKTQRPSVCNAIENVLVHKNIAEGFLKKLAERWNGKVTFVGDEASSAYITLEKIADDEDYRREFLDLKIAVKTVDDIDEAIAHINRFGTGHSECIVTEYLRNAEKFQREVDAAAVYVNASTRFTDGFEFGLGAEIGISTQKLHVRGPMGLEALTTFKYLVNGNGQTRG